MGERCTHCSAGTGCSAVDVVLEADRVACIVTAGSADEDWVRDRCGSWSCECVRGEEGGGRKADCGKIELHCGWFGLNEMLYGYAGQESSIWEDGISLSGWMDVRATTSLLIPACDAMMQGIC